MSYDVKNIIPLTLRISPVGLGFANFASAVLFAPESELPGGFTVDTYRSYSSMTELSVDFAAVTETNQAANRWLGGIPATNELKVYAVADVDADWTTTLDKARNQLWWFWSFFTTNLYNNLVDVEEVAGWCNTNESYFMNCQVSVSAAAIRDPGDSTDIASTLTASGVRFASTFSHAMDGYAGIALCKWFASVNYSATLSTITGEYKKLSGVAAEDLPSNEYAAMTQDTKKCQFYSIVDLQGSSDAGRVINTWSHSSFGEWMDDVVNLAAFVNSLKVDLFNAVANQTTKLGQDVVGQTVINGTAKITCERYISNGYLGPRNYIDPDDGVEKFTVGYEILTRPEEILDLSTPDRADRKSAPLRIRIFRKGAIHVVPVDIDVF